MATLQTLQERPDHKAVSNERACKSQPWIAGGGVWEWRVIIGGLQGLRLEGASAPPAQGSQPHHQVGPPVSRTVVQH